MQVVEGTEGRPRHLALQPRDLRPVLGLDGPPLELEGGGEEAALGGPHLAHQAHAAGDLELLQPGGSLNTALLWKMIFVLTLVSVREC